MLSKIRLLSAELKHRNCFRITFALAPFHGSDRQVGWSALEADRVAQRDITFITSNADFLSLIAHFPDNVSDTNPSLLEFETVKVAPWPFDLPSRVFPFGYFRYLVWVIILQLFIAVVTRQSVGKKFHFLTYTQLSTPIILPKSIDVSHGPAGTIPMISWRTPCKKSLIIKSQLMWRGIMPVISFLRRPRPVLSAVVHPSLEKTFKNNGQAKVISALNVDYLGDLENADLPQEKEFAAIAVGRNIPIKNMNVISEAFRDVDARNSLKFLMINSNLPGDYYEEKGRTVFMGRTDRGTVETYFRTSQLHVMLSLELGGYVNLEAAYCGVPTLCIDGYGASFMLQPSDPFRISLNDLHSGFIANKIVSILSDETILREESLLQAENARNFIAMNRRKFDDWLIETT